MLAPIELDDDALLGPEAVDCPGPDLLVAPREFDPVADEELAEAPFQAALHLAVAGGVLARRGAACARCRPAGDRGGTQLPRERAGAHAGRSARRGPGGCARRWWSGTGR